MSSRGPMPRGHLRAAPWPVWRVVKGDRYWWAWSPESYWLDYFAPTHAEALAYAMRQAAQR